MVEAPLVVPDVSFGESLLQTLDVEGFPVSVALWLREDERWILVLGSPSYDKVGPKDAYLQLISALSREGPVSLTGIPLRLRGHTDPLIKGLRKAFGKSDRTQGMRLGGHKIAGRWIDDAYVYRIR